MLTSPSSHFYNPKARTIKSNAPCTGQPNPYVCALASEIKKLNCVWDQVFVSGIAVILRMALVIVQALQSKSVRTPYLFLNFFFNIFCKVEHFLSCEWLFEILEREVTSTIYRIYFNSLFVFFSKNKMGFTLIFFRNLLTPLPHLRWRLSRG